MPKKNPETFQKIIDYINAYVADNGSTPTTREIAAGIGLAKSSVPKYLAAMEEDGRIAYDAHRRPLTRQMQEDMNDLTRSPFRVSVVGSIACGGPNEEEEYIEESVRLPKKIFGNGPLFILHARGESMIEAGIDDGDLVVIRQQPTATSHAIKKVYGQSCGSDRVYSTDQFKIMGGTNVSQMTKNTVRSNNRSGTPGVSFLTKKNRWKAELTFQEKKYYLGLHLTKEAAIKARESAYDSIVKPTLKQMKED